MRMSGVRQFGIACIIRCGVTDLVGAEATYRALREGRWVSASADRIDWRDHAFGGLDHLARVEA